MGEMYLPTAADYAQDTAQSAKEQAGANQLSIEELWRVVEDLQQRVTRLEEER